MQLMQGNVHNDRIPKEATTTTTHRTADKLLCKSQNSKINQEIPLKRAAHCAHWAATYQ